MRSEFIFIKNRLGEEHAIIELVFLCKSAIEIFIEPVGMDAEFLEEAHRCNGVATWFIDALATPVANKQAPVDGKFVAFCVTAEIIVIVEFRMRASGPMCCR